MSVFYKFKNTKEFQILPVSAPNTPVDTIKQLIKEKHQVQKSGNDDLAITNAQTKKEYNQGEQIPRQTYLIVKPKVATGGRMNQQHRQNATRNNSRPERKAVTVGSGIPQSMRKTVAPEDLQSGNQDDPTALAVADETGTLSLMQPSRSHFRKNRSQAAPSQDEELRTLWQKFQEDEYDPGSVPSDLKCAFSGLLLLDAVSLPCCGRVMSKNVAEQILRERTSVCPLCSTPNVSTDNLKDKPEIQEKAKDWLDERKRAAELQSTANSKEQSTEEDKPAASPEYTLYDMCAGEVPEDDEKELTRGEKREEIEEAAPVPPQTAKSSSGEDLKSTSESHNLKENDQSGLEDHSVAGKTSHAEHTTPTAGPQAQRGSLLQHPSHGVPQGNQTRPYGPSQNYHPRPPPMMPRNPHPYAMWPQHRPPYDPRQAMYHGGGYPMPPPRGYMFPSNPHPYGAMPQSQYMHPYYSMPEAAEREHQNPMQKPQGSSAENVDHRHDRHSQHRSRSRSRSHQRRSNQSKPSRSRSRDRRPSEHRDSQTAGRGNKHRRRGGRDQEHQ